MLNSMFSWNTTAMLRRSDSRVTLADIDAVDGHAPFIRHIEAKDQIEQRAFAGAARADDGDALADVELEAEIVENRRLAVFILERDTVEGDVIGDARQVGRAGTIGAAGRLVEQFLNVAHRRRRLDRHRDEMHQMRDVVGDLPERTLEGHEGPDGDVALGGEIGAEREHHEVQQQYRDRDRALDHGRQERRGCDLLARIDIAHREPAERAALQAESLDHRLCRDVLLHHAEKC